MIAIKQHKTAVVAKALLAAVHKVAPFKIHTILTDNGPEFAGRLFGRCSRHPAGAREFGQMYQALGIDRWVTENPMPQTNGMVGSFNSCPVQMLHPALQQCGGLGVVVASVCMAVSTPLAAKGAGVCSPSASALKLAGESA